jgi:hypothetical protein
MTPLVLYAIAFAGLSALAGVLLSVNRVPFLPRIAVAVATPWLAIAVWLAARPPAGWPRSGQPPQGALLVSGVVRPPSLGDPGEIDLWVEPPGATSPRAFRLPYSRPLHRRLIRALASQRATHGGVRLLVQRNAHASPGRGPAHRGLGFVEARLPTKQR